MSTDHSLRLVPATGESRAAARPAARDRAYLARRDSAGIRAMFELAERWRLDQRQLALLLGATVRTLQRWREAGEGEGFAAPLSADTSERMSYLLGIHKALAVLFPEEAAQLAWLRNDNASPAFGGQAPLARMLSGRVADLYHVRRYLDGIRG